MTKTIAEINTLIDQKVNSNTLGPIDRAGLKELLEEVLLAAQGMVTTERFTLGAEPLEGVSAVVAVHGKQITVDLTLDDVVLSVTDAAGSGSHGTVLLGEFTGFGQITAAYANLAYEEDGVVTGDGDGAYELGIGSAAIDAAADGTLASDEDDILADINTTASEGAGTAEAATYAAFAFTNGVDLNLNISGTAATVDANGDITLNGTIRICAQVM